MQRNLLGRGRASFSSRKGPKCWHWKISRDWSRPWKRSKGWLSSIPTTSGASRSRENWTFLLKCMNRLPMHMRNWSTLQTVKINQLLLKITKKKQWKVEHSISLTTVCVYRNLTDINKQLNLLRKQNKLTKTKGRSIFVWHKVIEHWESLRRFTKYMKNWFKRIQRKVNIFLKYSKFALLRKSLWMSWRWLRKEFGIGRGSKVKNQIKFYLPFIFTKERYIKIKVNIKKPFNVLWKRFLWFNKARKR